MHIIEIIYISAAIIALSACVPQVRQLLTSRASDEFSLSTWVTWFLTQCVTFIYVTAIGNRLMMVVNIAWIMFYATMVSLIIYYRRAAIRRVPLLADDDLA